MGLLIAGQLALRAVKFYQSPFKGSKSWRSSIASLLREKNVVLMGPPGAGKTTVGRMVAHRLGLPVIDVDEDVLEKTWKMSVAEKLAAVGGERFLEEEGQALCNLSASGCVVSLSGSNPLHTAAMGHVRQTGMIMYLDVDSEDILERLTRMKVKGMLGQDAGVSMRDILHYWKQFYEKWFDVRVLCGRGDTAEDVVEKVLRAVERCQNHAAETYVSTRRGSQSTCIQKTHFSDVVIEGLATDGGLYVPKNGFQRVDAGEWLRMADMSYPERAGVLLEKCIHPSDIPPLDLRAMVSRAYGSNFSDEAVAPVKHLSHNQYIQELFHGPTASFKDLALQLMPQLFSYCLPPMCNYLILVATSGDTGSAALSGFSRLSGTDRNRVGVLVFFPEEGVSEIQRVQMTSHSEGNARAVGVDSDFDFCQRAIQRMFGECGLTGHVAVEYGTVLSTANSINWARWSITARAIWICAEMASFGEPVDVCVPTGNFGNAMSAVYAKQMGIPIRKVICASNHNQITADFINTGRYDLRGRTLLLSHSPAIDILQSSNLERFIYHVSDGDSRLVRDLFTRVDRQRYFQVPGPLLGRIQQEVSASWCSEDECLAAIRSVYTQTGYVMDTHTTVAKVVADRLQDGSCPVVLCSTAHYGKFPPAVLRALQIQNIPEDPVEQLKELRSTVSRPKMHRDMMKVLEGSGRRAPAVRQADYSMLVEEVESMIRDSFLRVT